MWVWCGFNSYGGGMVGTTVNGVCEMVKRGERTGRTGRTGILPPLGVDFETALGALLRTPPPQKGEAADRRKVRKRKAGAKR